jgi:glycosyltransferase involved in cell wall biosynthesis
MGQSAKVLSILIPAWNEAATIAELLRRVLSVDLSHLNVAIEVVLCDDGSSDATATIARRMQASHPALVVVEHGRNQGKGAAVRTALDHARGELVLIQDADLEYGVEEYGELVAAALNGAQVVYGSRFLRRRYPTGMQLANYLGNRLLTWLANTLFSLHITDEATCLKLFNTRLLRSLGLRCRGFEFCPEVNARLGLLAVPIVEVPVEYRARSKAQGKKVSWRDALQAVWVMGSAYAGSRLRQPLPLPDVAGSASRAEPANGLGLQ